jgi:hypothetical protein
VAQWTLRLACLLTAAALIAGCGSSSQSTSSTGSAALHRLHKKGHKGKKGHRQRAARPAARFPPSMESAFRQNCAESVRNAHTKVPVQYRSFISIGISEYCTCSLDKLEASVSTAQFKHDLTAMVYGRPAPRYIFAAEQTCRTQLQGMLGELPVG